MKISKKKIAICVTAVGLAAVIAAVFIFSGAQYSFSPKEFSEQYPSATVVPAASSVSWNPEGYTLLGETDRLLLELDRQAGDLRVTDKQNNQIYGSHFDETKLETVPKNKKLLQGLQSVCSISYADNEGISDIVNSADSSVTMKAEGLENGVRLQYTFEKPRIALELSIWIDGETLLVDFSSENVTEEGDFSLMSVDILPMLMSADNSEDGYIVYPEGSGALYRWGSADTSRTTILTRDVWSDRNLDIDHFSDQINSGVRGILIPAMGIKRSAGSVVAYIERGAEYSSISLATSQYMFAVNRVYLSAIYRKTGTYIGANGTEYTQIDKKTNIDHITVRYAFGGAASDYSDMAATVRNMMMASGDLSQSKKDPYAMKLDVINGAVEETVLYSAYQAATTLAQAQDMTSYLEENGIENIAVELLGWQKEGFGLYPASGELAGKIGNASALKALSQQIKSMNSDLFLSVNLINASSDLGGFSKRSDVIYDATDVAVTSKDGTGYILNPYVAFSSKNASLVKRCSDWGVSGLSYEGVGRILFEDYNSKRRMTRTDTVAVQKAMLRSSADHCSKAVAQHGNSYVLSAADMITDVPSGTSTYAALQEEIPFYQLIVHGYVSYTLDIVANLSHDLSFAKLKWLEYGAMPYFVMSASGSQALTATAASSIYSSSFTDWKERMVEIYHQFAPLSEKISGECMVKHEKLAPGVYKTTYESGTAVIVNYNDSAYVYGQTEIAAGSYSFE